jgi:hypothetical protein
LLIKCVLTFCNCPAKQESAIKEDDAL